MSLWERKISDGEMVGREMHYCICIVLCLLNQGLE